MMHVFFSNSLYSFKGSIYNINHTKKKDPTVLYNYNVQCAEC